jgi:hypothetical protein
MVQKVQNLVTKYAFLIKEANSKMNIPFCELHQLIFLIDQIILVSKDYLVFDFHPNELNLKTMFEANLLQFSCSLSDYLEEEESFFENRDTALSTFAIIMLLTSYGELMTIFSDFFN